MSLHFLLAQTLASQESDVNINIDVNEGGKVAKDLPPVLSDDPIEITPEPSEEQVVVSELTTSLESIRDSLTPLNLDRLDSTHVSLISYVLTKPLAKMGVNLFTLWPSLESDLTGDAAAILNDINQVITQIKTV